MPRPFTWHADNDTTTHVKRGRFIAYLTLAYPVTWEVRRIRKDRPDLTDQIAAGNAETPEAARIVAELTLDQLTAGGVGTVLEAAEGVREAIRNEGVAAGYHRTIMSRHRSEWPSLWLALDRLLGSLKGK